jgi:hypothetical protein
VISVKELYKMRWVVVRSLEKRSSRGRRSSLTGKYEAGR